ncbi:MAG: HupE/UreJ family protein [Devosia sp.]
MTKAASRLALAAIGIFALSSPSFAHHAMGGETPTSLFEGLVTGMAHPVIGLDHLAFVVAVGLLAAVAGAPLFAPLLFVGGTLLGCAAFLSGISFAFTEWLIVLSVLALGLAIAAGHSKVRPAELGLFALAGLFHGMAYAEGIIGAEAAPLAAYLFGFAIVQAAIAIGIMLAFKALGTARTPLTARLAGAMVAGIGFTFAFEAVESLLLPAIA